MKKGIWTLFFILAISAFIITFLTYGTAAEAAEGAGTAGKTLQEIGQEESKLAAEGDVATKLLIEQTWRRRINEMLEQLEKRGVKITKEILEAVIDALGIDPVGPLTGESWQEIMVGGQIPTIDQKTITKYLDSYQYIEDVVEETTAETKDETASPSD